MPSVTRISVFLLSTLCALAPAPALIASKPLFDALRSRTVIRMKGTKMVADLVLPSEVPVPVYVEDKKGVISTVITASYMSIIVSIMALPVTLSAMSADIVFYGTKTKGSFLSEIVFAATIAIVSNLVFAAIRQKYTICLRQFFAVTASTFSKRDLNGNVRADTSVVKCNVVRGEVVETVAVRDASMVETVESAILGNS